MPRSAPCHEMKQDVKAEDVMTDGTNRVKPAGRLWPNVRVAKLTKIMKAGSNWTGRRKPPLFEVQLICAIPNATAITIAIR